MWISYKVSKIPEEVQWLQNTNIYQLHFSAVMVDVLQPPNGIYTNLKLHFSAVMVDVLQPPNGIYTKFV